MSMSPVVPPSRARERTVASRRDCNRRGSAPIAELNACGRRPALSASERLRQLGHGGESLIAAIILLPSEPKPPIRHGHMRPEGDRHAGIDP